MNTLCSIWSKIKYVVTHRYHPYWGYWYDLFTERWIKYRSGECIDCINCCRCTCNLNVECYCSNLDINAKRCTIYDHRTCDIWFPVSPKEIECMKKYNPQFTCRFTFNKNK